MSQAARNLSQSPFWTPITPLTGSFFHADPHSFATGFAVAALLFAYWDVGAKLMRRSMSEEDPTSDLRAWVGTMVPNFSKDYTELEIWIYIIGVGADPFQVKSLDGRVILNGQNSRGARTKTPLSMPSLKDYNGGFYEQGHYGPTIITMALPRSVSDNLPEMFTWNSPRSYLDFNELNIWIETAAGDRKRLKVWESMRLTAGENEVRYVETTIIPPAEREAMKKALDSLTALTGPLAARDQSARSA